MKVTKHTSEESTLTLKPKADVSKSKITGVPVVPQKGFMSSNKIFKKKEQHC